ncbi:hypothetical protein MTP99_019826 [Tenebrio molitor]|nr:hypothetical protein MTP99_019826 [Tenebrio molitor]
MKCTIFPRSFFVVIKCRVDGEDRAFDRQAGKAMWLHRSTSRLPSSWEIWQRWLNLELDEVGCLVSCAERSSQEDTLLRKQIERYNQGLLELEDEKRS